MDSKIEIWLSLTREQFPGQSDEELALLSLDAASQWYLGKDNELTKLFDQYVMLKTLKGI